MLASPQMRAGGVVGRCETAPQGGALAKQLATVEMAPCWAMTLSYPMAAQAGLTTWEAVINHWQRSIGELASEIEHGAAAVVLNDANDLRYCDVLPLLRLAERQRLWQESCAPAR